VIMGGPVQFYMLLEQLEKVTKKDTPGTDEMNKDKNEGRI